MTGSDDSGKRRPTKVFAVADDAPERPDQIYYQMAGKKRRGSATWYRGKDVNFHPMRASLDEPDAVDKYVGEGWFPDRPFITRDHFITAFGSCFAGEVTKFLVSKNYNIFAHRERLKALVVSAGEGIVSSAGLRQQFDWAWGDQAPQSEVWHDKNGELVDSSEEIRQETREIFEKTEVFIFTLGISEVWYDKQTEDVFWRAIPADSFDPERHGFRVLGAAENQANLEHVYQMIRKHRPDAKIIFTLSPVAQLATFRPVSCMTASAVSKASLRVAVDELMRAHEDDDDLYYFPSYEMAIYFVPDALGDDLRHLRPETIDFVMSTFARRFLID